MEIKQEWETVVLKKKKSNINNSIGNSNNNSNNKINNQDFIKMKKIENDSENLKNKKVDKDLCRKIQAARLSKKITQKQLAIAINEKADLINKLESGSAIHDGKLISKVKKYLNIHK